MRYEVISRSILTDFENVVAQYIKEGWKPKGGICVVDYCTYPTTYYQAMVRE